MAKSERNRQIMHKNSWDEPRFRKTPHYFFSVPFDIKKVRIWLFFNTASGKIKTSSGLIIDLFQLRCFLSRYYYYFLMKFLFLICVDNWILAFWTFLKLKNWSSKWKCLLQWLLLPCSLTLVQGQVTFSFWKLKYKEIRSICFNGHKG